MNISALFDLIDWQVFLLTYVAVFGLAIVVFRGCAYGPYDPAWIVVASLGVPVTLVAYLYWVGNVGSGARVAYMAVTLLAFLFGARATRAVLRHIHRRRPMLDFSGRVAQKELLQLRTILSFLHVLILTMVALRAATQGLPILATDPELAKVEVNTQGFGLITRLLSPAITMSLSISFLLAAKKVVARRHTLFALTPPLVALLASGSKGGLIALLVSFTAVQAYLIGMDAHYRAPRPGRILAIAAATILGYAFLVLVLRAFGTGEGDPLAFALTTFGVRLIAYGDGVFYYFSNELDTILSFHPIDFVWDYILAPVLALLRLIDYPVSLGLKISGEMFGSDKFGPNPTVFVEGYAYFGAIFGPVYAAFIGALFQSLRSNVFARATRFRTWGFLWFTMMFPLAQMVASDMLLFVAEVINTLLVAALVWIVHGVFSWNRQASPSTRTQVTA